MAGKDWKCRILQPVRRAGRCPDPAAGIHRSKWSQHYRNRTIHEYIDMALQRTTDGWTWGNDLIRLFGVRAAVATTPPAAVRRFRSDRRGASAILVAIALTSLVAAVGLAI